MNIGIIRTGHVAQTLAAAWAKTAYTVTPGSRTPETNLLFPVAALSKTARGADINATAGGSTLS